MLSCRSAEFPFPISRSWPFWLDAMRRLAFRSTQGLRLLLVPKFRFPCGPRSLWNSIVYSYLSPLQAFFSNFFLAAHQTAVEHLENIGLPRFNPQGL